MIQQEKAREYGVYLSQSPHVFEEYLATHFKHTSFDVLSRNYTTETLEEMAFMTAIYKAAGLPDADYKMLRFEEAVPRAKPNGGKRATVMEQLGSAQARADKLDLITAQCNVILEKFNLIDRWIAVARGEFVPILTPDTDLWKHEYFLNYRSMVCRPVLEAMMEDADNFTDIFQLAMSTMKAMQQQNAAPH